LTPGGGDPGAHPRTPPFYFGCEADGRMNVVAFGKGNPFSARINAIFSSDAGHCDVPDMRMVLPRRKNWSADGLITADDFRDFCLANAIRLWGTQNPDFLEGAAVADTASAVLGKTPGRGGGVAFLRRRQDGDASKDRRP